MLHMLNINSMSEGYSLLDPVALRIGVPEHGLVAGQVGTIVEKLDRSVFEVEFSDDNGVAYALAAIPADSLIALHYCPVAA